MGEFYIAIHRGPGFEAVHRIHDGETLIGRSTDCGLWLADVMVSRQHAMISNSSQGVSIQDLGSCNGVLLNGRRIRRENHILRDGDQLVIGPYLLIVCLSSEKMAEVTGATSGSTQAELHVTNAIASSNESTGIHFTPAQLRIHDLLLRGMAEKEIAYQLDISINTVHHHVKAIYKAMSVSTRGEFFAHWMNSQNQNQNRNRTSASNSEQ